MGAQGDPIRRILNDEALDLLFREARTHNVWLERVVSDGRYASCTS